MLLTRRRLLPANVATTRLWPLACVDDGAGIADGVAVPDRIAGCTNRCGVSLAAVAAAVRNVVVVIVVETGAFFVEPPTEGNSLSILRLIGLAGVTPAV